MTLNIVSVIPSPTTSETEGEKIPVRVVTRAQKNAQTKLGETEETPRKPRRKTRSKRSKNSKGKTNDEDSIPQELKGVLRPTKASTTAELNTETLSSK